MARIIVVRHAESIANTQGIYQGQTYDTGLSTLGKKQALALAKRLLRSKIDKIYSSPLIRTIETAREVANKLGKRVELVSQIIETNHGLWEGEDKIWISKNYPNIIKTWSEKPSYARFPDGESFRDTVKRVKKYIHDKKWVGTSLLITHDNIVRILVCLSKNISIDCLWEAQVEPAAINIFEVKGIDGTKKLRVIRLNDIRHLEKLRADLSSHAL